MFSNKSELMALFEEESAKTQAVLTALTAEACSQPLAPGFKTAGELAFHLIMAIPAISQFLGFVYTDLPPESIQSSPQQLSDAYRRIHERCTKHILDLTDEQLFQQRFAVYSQQWSAAYTISILIRHEIHHRGQLTVLMRQAGLALPDIYGPAKRTDSPPHGAA